MMLFLGDRVAKTNMRRLITDITDQNQIGTDRLCDALEVAYKPDGMEDPRISLAKVAWEWYSTSIPVYGKTGIVFEIAMPMIFDDFRESVREFFT